MRRLFVVLLVLSLGATAAAVYWRTFLPEGSGRAATAQAPASRGAGDERSRAPSTSAAPGPASSDRQDLAVAISIFSSVVSALAALAQTWLTARAMATRRPGD